MTRRVWVLLTGGALFAGAPATLKLRGRTEVFRGSDDWREVPLVEKIDPAHTAIIICDMWDKHWCRGATERVNVLARKMNPVLHAARKRGVMIVHAPSDTMDFYSSSPQRRAIQEIAKAATPEPMAIDAPRLPIDDSDGGCDTPGDKSHKAWTRQHPLIDVAANDLISDKGDEIYSMLKLRGVKHLLIMGVHTNMCILNRTFAIKQMTKWGMRCILVRDLTDSMYDPQDRPFVSHEQGTELVVQYIEKYWAPSVLSGDLMRALGN